ncbi:hypothetical protein [Microvirga puerhi]|uniref:DUF4261 domain-containing protein n=1 Tax=Microvirga puerhi TaxID=2876078 RepID=A0ABS7VW62_9HYPH|nr:hypothetical protein [Microvirga puerhi]MBZ6079396.1 hypothetical protein [Microvirga puerhi]
MGAVLKHVGPGRYRYGWHLNLEQAREEDLRDVPGIEMENIRPLTVHAVDFRRWSNWDEYWAGTSNNTRRNAKRAEKADLHVQTRVGLKCLLHVSAIIRLRSVMYERKGIQFDWIRALLSYIGGHLTAPSHRISAIISEMGQPQAAFIGFEFGTHTYYIAGGSQPSNNGVAWYLQKLMLYRAWERTGGRATYIMGHVDYETHDETIGGGLLRSRRAVNASNYETSVITFRYRPSSVASSAQLHSDS